MGKIIVFSNQFFFCNNYGKQDEDPNVDKTREAGMGNKAEYTKIKESRKTEKRDKKTKYQQKRANMKQTDKDYDEGMRYRWSEVGKGQVRERNRKTPEGRRENHRN